MTPALLALLLQAAAPSSAAELPVDEALVQGLPTHELRLEAHGEAMVCTGVALYDLLPRLGVDTAKPLGGARLAQRLVAEGRDGYRVVFGLGELDPTLGAADIIVTRECDGKPLDDQAGPWRLVVAGEARPARSVRQLAVLRIEGED